MDGARGLVEILAELAGTAVAHERVERVVGEGAARNTAQRRRADALRQKAAPIDAAEAAATKRFGLGHGTVPWQHAFSMPPTRPQGSRLRVAAGKFMAGTHRTCGWRP